MIYASRPLSEFNSYEALGMIKTVQRCAHDNKAEKEAYYRLVYQAARDKRYLSTLHFRSLLLRLLGDTNYDTVCNAVSQVEKSYARDARKEQPVATRNFMSAARSSPRSLRCFYCQQPGYITFTIFHRNISISYHACG